jgi:hypothetical protein
VYVFTVLLNFFYLKPIHLVLAADDENNDQLFLDCKECVQSTCFPHQRSPCVLNPQDNNSYLCLHCDPDLLGTKLLHTLDACQPTCLGANQICGCQLWCYMCFDTTIFDPVDYACKFPITQVDANCQTSPYLP